MTRNTFLASFILVMVSLMPAQVRSFKGTVIRMQMAECPAQRGLMAALSGTSAGATTPCPEYTVVSDKVVYVITGHHADQFIPLAEEVDFLVKKNELVVLSDDEKSQTRFFVKAMALRSIWEREEEHRALMMRLAERSLSNYELRNSPTAAELEASYK